MNAHVGMAIVGAGTMVGSAALITGGVVGTVTNPSPGSIGIGEGAIVVGAAGAIGALIPGGKHAGIGWDSDYGEQCGNPRRLNQADLTLREQRWSGYNRGLGIGAKAVGAVAGAALIGAAIYAVTNKT